jgi:hypothetical protein
LKVFVGLLFVALCTIPLWQAFHPSSPNKPPQPEIEQNHFPPPTANQQTRIMIRGGDPNSDNVTIELDREIRIMTGPEQSFRVNTEMIRELAALPGVIRIDQSDRYRISIDKGNLFEWTDLLPKIRTVITKYYGQLVDVPLKPFKYDWIPRRHISPDVKRLS